MKRVCKKFPRLSPPHSPAKPSKQPKKGALALLAEPCGPSDSPFKPERSRRGRTSPPLTERAVHLADTWRPARADMGNLSPLPSPPASGKSSLSPFPGQTDSSASLLSPRIRRPPRPFQSPPALLCGPHTRKAVPSTREAGRPSRTVPAGRRCPSPFKGSLLAPLAGRPSSTRCSAGKTPFLHCFLQ